MELLRLSELALAAAAQLDVGTLESELPALPVTVLHDLVPHLSLFYLDRLQGALQQRGVSLEPKWKQLCEELVGKQVGCKGLVATHTPPHEGATTWHERFMGLLFRVLLGGLESGASRKRPPLPFTPDPRFCALEMCAARVRRLAVSPPLDAFCSLLRPARAPVLAALARALPSLAFTRLGLGSDCCPEPERLGAVVGSLCGLREVSFERCFALRPELLWCVLGACVGSGMRLGGPGVRVEAEGTAKRPRWDASSDAAAAGDGADDEEMELLYSDLWPDEQEHLSDDDDGPEDLFDVSLTEGPRQCRCRENRMAVMVTTMLECLGIEVVENEGNCDYDNLAAGGRGALGWVASLFPTRAAAGYSDLYCVPCPPLAVTVLRLSSTPLSAQCASYLEEALSRWVCLERLVLIDTELGNHVLCVLHALQRLSRLPSARFSHLDLRDDWLALNVLTVTGCALRSFPRLHSLRLATAMPARGPLRNCRPRGRPPPCRLRELSLHTGVGDLKPGLLELLESSRGWLRRVSLRDVTPPSRDDLGPTLRALAAPGNRLDSLCLVDMGTGLELDALAEAVGATRIRELALRHCPSSFTVAGTPRWDGLVLALRRHADLRRLALTRNRLCRQGLRALATLFGEGAACRVTHLDVSFNCLEPDALLEFATALAGEGLPGQGGYVPHRLEVLDITGNWLQREPEVAKRTLALLRTRVDRVLHDGWDSTHAFADHVSVM